MGSQVRCMNWISLFPWVNIDSVVGTGRVVVGVDHRLGQALLPVRVRVDFVLENYF